MEVHSHGLDILGRNKEAGKAYNPEFKDIRAPPLSQIPAADNTAVVHANEDPPKDAGLESNIPLTSTFSFPPEAANFNISPEIAFQPFVSVETGKDPHDEINQVPEHDEAFDSVENGKDPHDDTAEVDEHDQAFDDMVILENDQVPEHDEAFDSVENGKDPHDDTVEVDEHDQAFDDMVILENDMIASANVDQGVGETLDGFQVTDVQREKFNETPVLDTYNMSSVAADVVVTEENVDGTTSDISGALPAEVTFTQISKITVVTTVNHEVTATEPIEAATAISHAPLENESPPAAASEFEEENVVEVTEDTVMANAHYNTVQKTKPAFETLEISDEDILAIKGQKVIKKFGRKNYPGEVVDFDPETKWFKVVYEDGDDEDLELSEVKEILSSIKRKRPCAEADADDKSSGKTGKKPRKTGSESTAKKFRSGSESAVKSPKTPGSKAKGSRKSRASKKAKSPAKLIRKALNSLAFKTPANFDVTKEKGKDIAGTVTPKGTKRGSTKKSHATASRNLKSKPPTSQKGAKGKTSTKTSSSKLANLAGFKRKISSGEGSSMEKSRRSRRQASEVGWDADLVGKNLRKDFDGTFYDGVVLQFDKKTKFYKVKYTDGDTEDLELHELEPILVQRLSNTSTKTSSSKLANSAGVKRKISSGEGSSMEKSRTSRRQAPEVGWDADLVGKNLSKDFDGTLFDGVVVQFDKKTKFYKVKYTDGDTEDLELHELEPILVHRLSNTDEKDDKPAKLSSLSSLRSADKASSTRKRK